MSRLASIQEEHRDRDKDNSIDMYRKHFLAPVATILFRVSSAPCLDFIFFLFSFYSLRLLFGRTLL